MTPETILFLKAFALIKSAQRILVVADSSPDGDSIGSSTAMVHWLIAEGKEVSAFCQTLIPRNLSYLDEVHRFTNDLKIFEQSFDLILTFDTGGLKRAGIDEGITKTPKGYQIINFDHHQTNERFGDLNVLLIPASSTAEVVYRFFESNNIAVDAAMATSLVSGLWTDTFSFTNAATTPLSLQIAGKLFAHGARVSDITKYIIKDKPVAVLKLFGLALSRLQKNDRYKIAHTYLLERDLERVTRADEYIEWITNTLFGMCAEMNITLLLRENKDGKIKGSFRSLTRDVSKVAKLLGGGGHRLAAGFTIPGRLRLKGGKISVE